MLGVSALLLSKGVLFNNFQSHDGLQWVSYLYYLNFARCYPDLVLSARGGIFWSGLLYASRRVLSSLILRLFEEIACVPRKKLGRWILFCVFHFHKGVLYFSRPRCELVTLKLRELILIYYAQQSWSPLMFCEADPAQPASPCCILLLLRCCTSRCVPSLRSVPPT